MRATRRVLHVVSWIGTVAVGRSPWRSSCRRRRGSATGCGVTLSANPNSTLNGQLTIGGFGGNLLFGADLSDVTVDLSGARVLSVKSLALDYSVFEIVRNGLVLSRIRIDQPYVLVERGRGGLEPGQPRQAAADIPGPGRPALRSRCPPSRSPDGQVVFAGDVGGEALNLPGDIRDLDVKASVDYAPTHYTVKLDHLSFSGTSPDLVLKELSGTLAMHDGNLYLQQVALDTAETSVKADGVIENYLRSPVVKLTTTGHVSLPEIGRVVPAASGYPIHPTFEVTASGPASALALDLNVRSEAGNAQRATHDRCAVAGSRRSRRGQSPAPQSRADSQGPGTGERHHGARDARRHDGFPSGQRAGHRSAGRDLRLRGPAGRRVRLRGPQREGFGLARWISGQSRRPCGSLRRHRDRPGVHRAVRAGAAAGVRFARPGRRCRSAPAAGSHGRTADGDEPVGRRLPRRGARNFDLRYGCPESFDG